MATILLADDEARIRRLVVDFLRREGNTVVEAANGKQAIELLDHQRSRFDLVILDVMMPEADGFTVLQHIRDTDGEKRMPVMMLTARAEESDEIYGLTQGADDYITKPFSPLVLVARVKTLLNRYGKEDRTVSKFGALVIDEMRREVRIENKICELTPKEYELLIYFKNNKNIALSRESILNAVWGYDYFGDLRTVDTHIKKLRAKLGEHGSMIETVRGYGYRFEAAV